MSEGQTIVSNCPTYEPGQCANVSAFETGQIVTWHHGFDTPWPCDGSVYWKLCMDDSECRDMHCITYLNQNNDFVIHCPSTVAPAKYWDRAWMQSSWLTVKACNTLSNACSDGCQIELIWPDYCIGTTLIEYQACCDARGGCDQFIPPSTQEAWKNNEKDVKGKKVRVPLP